MRPTRLEIDLSAIAHNLAQLQAHVGPQVGIIAVVKANAYGHGVLRVSRIALKAGSRLLAVALLQEALELREAGIEAEILTMGAHLPDEAEEFVARDITATVGDAGFARALARAAARQARVARCHVKIDSGMNRLGVRVEEAEALGRTLSGLGSLNVEAVFSHFASAPGDTEFTELQIAAFHQGVTALERGLGRGIPLKHLANTGGTLHYPASHLAAVRPGAAMYGIANLDEGASPLDLQPAMSLQTAVAQVKSLKAGETTGYSRTYEADHETRIALLPVGYADGYPRALSSCAEALVRGVRCPVIGRVSMDSVVLDVGGLPGVGVGEPVVLLGSQGSETITAGELAHRAGSIVQEVVSRMGSRLPRVYRSAPEDQGGDGQ